VKDLSCWEIMNCQGPDDCPARLHPDKNCWELIQEMEDYRAEFNICRDCLVYVVKTGALLLSDQEMHEIAQEKCCAARCALSAAE